MSDNADATAALGSGFSGGTLLYTVLSESVTSSDPSFVIRTIFPLSIDVTSPVTTDGFMDVGWAIELNAQMPISTSIAKPEMKLRSLITINI
jgi:hypothetical protein